MVNYLCPKCGSFMCNISTCSMPPKSYYQCFSCGYKSKFERARSTFVTLPRDLWTDEEREEKE